MNTHFHMYRVLLIENSDTQRFALLQTLNEAGYEVIECQDYWQAINILRVTDARELNAVILGWVDYEAELLALLKKLLSSAEFTSIPAIILTDEKNEALKTWLQSRPASKLLDHGQHVEILDYLTHLQRHEAIARANQIGGKRQRGVSVLLIDDSPHDVKRYQRILSTSGYAITIANEISSAIDYVREDGFDIVIVDYFILDSDAGREFIREVQANPALSRLRTVVLISTYVDKAVQDSLELGAVECVFKTETDALFLARINALASQVVLQKTAESERRRFEAILGSVGEGVYGVNDEGHITFMNPAGLAALGFTRREDFIGRPAQSLIHIHDAQRKKDSELRDVLADSYFSGAELKQHETIFTQKNGQKINVVCTVSPLDVGGQRQGSVVAFRDITERKRMERRLIWQATRDPLTDLFNRRYFEQALKREVNKVQHQTGVHSALLYIDFDKFKYLNDTAGHDAGDKLLVEASQRLKECVRTSDDVARLGGDEFAVILRDVESEEALQISEHLRNMLQEVAYISEDVSFKLGSSIGVAMIEQGMQDKDVLANADIACNIAKRKGRNQSHLYSTTTNEDRESMNEEIVWSSKLQKALDDDDFFLMYQPILPIDQIDFDSLPGEPNRLWASLSHLPDHYEVLIRLKDADNAMISPGAFLQMAERFNLIQQIDLWVVRKSIQVLERLKMQGRDASFSVNLSGATLSSGEILAEIQNMLSRTSVPPSSVVFEITETSAIEKMDVARNFIETMRKSGWRFALDDFGTGFSSFSQLKYLPVDIVKIDGQFVRDMSIDPIDRAIVIAINEIAHSLGIETIAEYVETRETLELLNRCGVNHAQGFYISKPMREIEQRADSATLMLRLAEPIQRF